MRMAPKTDSLASAAAALEAETQAYLKTIAELERVEVTSEKTMQRARRALEQCAKHEYSHAHLLPELAKAMQALQREQQSCIDATARSAASLKDRFENRQALLQRVSALGERAREINEPIATLMQAQPEEEKPSPDMMTSLGEVLKRTEAVIAEAEELQRLAKDSSWVDLSEDADTLKQQLLSARNKVLLVQRKLASGAPS